MQTSVEWEATVRDLILTFCNTDDPVKQTVINQGIYHAEQMAELARIRELLTDIKAALVPAAKQPEPPNTLSDPERCPRCGEAYPHGDSHKCRTCGECGNSMPAHREDYIKCGKQAGLPLPKKYPACPEFKRKEQQG